MAWGDLTPMHNAFIKRILQAKKHMIFTTRRKIDWIISKDEKTGKMKPEKAGLKPSQRETWEYEISIDFHLNQEHFATVNKDRTSVFADTIPFIISEETGQKIIEWNKSGAVNKDIIDNQREQELLNRFDEIQQKYLSEANISTVDFDEKAHKGVLQKIKEKDYEWAERGIQYVESNLEKAIAKYFEKIETKDDHQGEVEKKQDNYYTKTAIDYFDQQYDKMLKHLEIKDKKSFQKEIKSQFDALKLIIDNDQLSLEERYQQIDKFISEIEMQYTLDDQLELEG
jgi:hypothetical protein